MGNPRITKAKDGKHLQCECPKCAAIIQIDEDKNVSVIGQAEIESVVDLHGEGEEIDVHEAPEVEHDEGAEGVAETGEVEEEKEEGIFQILFGS